MMTQPHTATITIVHPDRDLLRFVAFDTAMRIGDLYGETIVPHSLIVYHDRDQPYTARLVWQTEQARAGA
jgi:hypothetical protein